MFVLIVGGLWYARGIISKSHFLLPSFFLEKIVISFMICIFNCAVTFLLVSLFFSIEKST